MKSLQRAPREIAAAVRKKLERLADDPFDRNADVTKLRNRPGYRLRVGEWRVIYEIQKAQVITMVLKIAPRGEVFK
jgi:mRNA interferase RelE/StbE